MSWRAHGYSGVDTSSETGRSSKGYASCRGRRATLFSNGRPSWSGRSTRNAGLRTTWSEGSGTSSSERRSTGDSCTCMTRKGSMRRTNRRTGVSANGSSCATSNGFRRPSSKAIGGWVLGSRWQEGTSSSSNHVSRTGEANGHESSRSCPGFSNTRSYRRRTYTPDSRRWRRRRYGYGVRATHGTHGSTHVVHSCSSGAGTASRSSLGYGTSRTRTSGSTV